MGSVWLGALACALAVGAAPKIGQPILTSEGAPTLEVVAQIPVEHWVKSVELSPDGRYAVTANLKGRTATVIHTKTLAVHKTLRAPAFSPVETVFAPSLGRVYISGGFLSHDVTIWNPEDWSPAGVIPGGRRGPEARHTVFPKIMALSPDASRLFVAYWVSGNVGVFDTADHRRLGLIPVGDRPRGMVISADGTKGYVCRFGDRKNSITVFKADGPPYGVIKTMTNLPNPRHLVLDDDGKFLYVSVFGGEGGVAKIDAEKDQVVLRSKPTGRASKTLKLSPDGRYVFVVNYGPGTVSVLDTETLTEQGRYGAGKFPQGLAISSDGRRLWTTVESGVVVWDVTWPHVDSPRALNLH